jgi:hypothetical protein
MPKAMNPIGRVTHLDQCWSIFAPFPLTEDGWIAVKGILEDGTEVNLWKPNEDLTLEKPVNLSASFPTDRWRKYIMNICMVRYSAHRGYFVDWLRRRWETCGAMQASSPLKTVEFLFYQENTPPPGEPVPEPVNMTLWRWTSPTANEAVASTKSQ